MDNRRKTQTLSIGIMLVLLGVLSFLYWGNQKEVWFCDEIYSYESANGFEQDWPASETGTWMTGADVERFFAADWENLSLNDISVRLYNDHVPLYFWLFRVVSWLCFEGNASIWIGLVINFVFYLTVLTVIYKMFVKLTDSPVAAGVVMLLTGVINRLMLNQATMLRMYMMLLWEEVFLVLAGLWILKSAEKSRMSPGVFVFLFVVSTAGLLTHYDFWIFYAVTAALFCLWLLLSAWKKERFLWHRREFYYVLAWVGNFLASLGVTLLLFPYCRWNLNRGKGQMALQSLVVFNREKWENICWGYYRLSASVFGEKFPVLLGLLLIFGSILGGAYLLYRRKQIRRLAGLALIVMVAQAYQLVVCFTLPDAQEERYLWASFTLMMWCAAYGGILLLQSFFAGMKNVRRSRVWLWIVSGVLSAAFLVVQILAIDRGNGVAYLFHPDKDVVLLKEHSSEPWVVYSYGQDVYSYFDWMIPEQICFISQEKTAGDAAAIREMTEADSFVLYCYAGNVLETLNYFEQVFGQTLNCEYLTGSTNYTVYTIEKM